MINKKKERSEIRRNKKSNENYFLQIRSQFNLGVERFPAIEFAHSMNYKIL